MKPRKPKTAKLVSAAPALRTWLESPNAKRFQSAMERAAAPQNAEHRASVAVGQRRLEVRRTGKLYDVLDPKTGEPVPYVKRHRAKSYKPETAAEAKRRWSREVDTKSRKDATTARQRRGDELRAMGRKVRGDRSKAIQTARDVCKVDQKQAKTVQGPARRVAVAKARTRCAGGLLAVEKRFERELDGIRKQLAALSAESAGARRRRRPTMTPRPRAAERREERDDAIEAELERRGLAHLVAIWRAEKDSPALRSLKFDRAIERFLELIGEREDLVHVAHEQTETAIAETAQCEQAAFYAAQGDEQAALWGEEHCDEDNRPRRKLSAVERTASMFDGITPPAATKGSKKKAPRRGPPPRPGQGTLGVGSFGASLLDTHADQTVLGGTW